MNDNDSDLNDKYKMLKVIGIGAFGVVFTAVNKKTRKRVAIKKVSFIYNFININTTYR